MKYYLFQLSFSYVIIFKKVTLYLKNISLSGRIWRILPKKRKRRHWSSRPRNVSMQSTLTLSEVFWYLFQKSSNNVQKGEGFCIFQSLYFHDLTFSSREETELVSGKHTPAGLGNPAEHHLPPPPRSVPLGLLTLSPMSPVSKRPCLQLCLGALRCHVSVAYKWQCWAWPCSAQVSGT